MSYQTAEMPPVIRITAQNSDGTIDWQLESQSGSVVSSHTSNGISHPDDWWDDMADALLSNFPTESAAFDMVRFNAFLDYEVIDER